MNSQEIQIRELISKPKEKCLTLDIPLFLNKNLKFDVNTLKAKLLDLFDESTFNFKLHYKRAIELVRNKNVALLNNQTNRPLELVWDGLLELLANHIKTCVRYCKKLPGFETLSRKDISTVLSKRLFVVFGFKTCRLFMQNDYFLMLSDGTQYNRFWMNTTYGSKLCDKIFGYHDMLNSLDLTDQELAILVPFALTLQSKI